MAAAYPVHEVKVKNQDLIKATKDGYLQPLQGQLVYYYWAPPSTKKPSAMRGDGEDRYLQLLQGQLYYYWNPPNTKKSSAKMMRDDDDEDRDEDNVYGSKKYGKPRNIMG